MTRALLLGSGASFQRRLRAPGDPDGASWDHYGELVRLDWNPAHRPDVVHELGKSPWPFEDNFFDRVDAYEILEHLHSQGDFLGFFHDFSEAWRILKPGGIFGATVPSWQSQGAWGDPSHKRVITKMSLLFLDQTEYVRQVGKTTMSDFRFCWNGDFETVFAEENSHTLGFILRSHKPARIQ